MDEKSHFIQWMEQNVNVDSAIWCTDDMHAAEKLGKYLRYFYEIRCPLQVLTNPEDCAQLKDAVFVVPALPKLCEPDNIYVTWGLPDRPCIFVPGKFVRSMICLPNAVPGMDQCNSSVEPVTRSYDPLSDGPLQDYISRLRRDALVKALKAARGNKAQAARMLSLNRTTLVESMKSLNITKADFS